MVRRMNELPLTALLSLLAPKLPVFIAAIIGATLTLTRSERLGSARYLAATGFSAFGLLEMVNPIVVQFIIASNRGRPVAELAPLLGLCGVVENLLLCGAVVLLVVAFLSLADRCEAAPPEL